MLLVVGLVFSFVLLTSGCKNISGGSAGVLFTVDGTAYGLTRGYTDNNEFIPNASGAISESGTGIRIAAVSDVVSDMNTEGPLVWISVDGVTEGTYTQDDSIFFGLVLADGTRYWTNTSTMDLDGSPLIPDTFTIVISTFPDAPGGTITGTFSGTLNRGAISIANGTFAVERLEDGALSPPDAFQ
jgi:hypothetical protein